MVQLEISPVVLHHRRRSCGNRPDCFCFSNDVCCLNEGVFCFFHESKSRAGQRGTFDLSDLESVDLFDTLAPQIAVPAMGSSGNRFLV